MTHGSLFSGIDSFGYGFAKSGIKTTWRVEIDRNCQGVLRRHYPNDLLLLDVRECGAHNLTRVDIISFGSPCQDLSQAGLRMGLKGDRSGLFFEGIRIISELKPSFAVWENVPHALTINNGRDFRNILCAFRECGARDIAWRTLNAQYLGVAQRRRRVFLVADFRGECAAEVLFESDCCAWHPAAGQKARKKSSIANPRSFRGVSKYSHIEDNNIKSDVCYIFGGDVSHTLTSEGSDASEDGTGRGVPLVFVSNQNTIRHLTPREIERLFAIPDDYTAFIDDKPVSNTARYKMLGNSIVTTIPEWIGYRIYHIINNATIPGYS